MSKILVVLFDLGNVLFLADHRRTIEGLVLADVPRQLAETYFKRTDYAEMAKGRLTFTSFVTFLNHEWQTKLRESTVRGLHASHVYALDTGAMGLVGGLMKVRVGYVTNTQPVEWGRYVHLYPPFEERPVWRSDRHGVHKADPGVPEDIIGRWIPERLGIAASPDEVLFVDDSETNCAAFAAAGVQAFRYSEGKPWELEIHLRKLGLLSLS